MVTAKQLWQCTTQDKATHLRLSEHPSKNHPLKPLPFRLFHGPIPRQLAFTHKRQTMGKIAKKMFVPASTTSFTYRDNQ